MARTFAPLFHEVDVPGGDQDRARRLLETAYELLDESGLEGLTIRAVLARAGLARRAFYECFEGKDDLVLAVFESSLRGAAMQFRELTEACSDPIEALRIVITGIVLGQLGQERAGANRRGAALSREHLRLAQSRPDELQAALGPLLDVMAGHVAAGIEVGAMRKADPMMQARLMYNLVSTTIHTVLMAEEGGVVDPREREDLAETLWEFCRRAITV